MRGFLSAACTVLVSLLLAGSGVAVCPVPDETADFLVTDIHREPNGAVVISFPSCSDHLYELLVITNPQDTASFVVLATAVGQDGPATFTDPTPPAAAPRFYRVNRLAFADDEDNDGLDNLREFQLGTNLHHPDTDGDGLPDGWEVAYGLNPLVNDATGDPDGDGVDNLTEYRQGRDPTRGAVPDTTGAVNLTVYSPLE